MTKYFLTVDWCNQGHRGIFCDLEGNGFWKEFSEYTSYEMQEILGPFAIILSPKSEPFTEEQIKEYKYFRPLAEYKNQFGIAVKERC